MIIECASRRNSANPVQIGHFLYESAISQEDVFFVKRALTDVEDDVDEGGDVAHVHVPVAIYISD